MKIISFLVLILIFAVPATAQNQKLSGKEKKELRKKKEAEQLEWYKQIALDSAWVIEATTVYDQSGQPYQVNPTLNFVAQVGSTTTIQLSFDNISGWNDVGGITLEGQLTKYEIKGKEGKPFTLTARTSGAVMGTVDLIVNMNSSGQASCTIRTATTSTRIAFGGQFMPVAESRVYKGRTFK